MTICQKCEKLTLTFESAASKYRAARSAVLYRISTEFAAKQLVDMERARCDMEEHMLICPFAATVAAACPL